LTSVPTRWHSPAYTDDTGVALCSESRRLPCFVRIKLIDSASSRS